MLQSMGFQRVVLDLATEKQLVLGLALPLAGSP